MDRYSAVNAATVHTSSLGSALAGSIESIANGLLVLANTDPQAQIIQVVHPRAGSPFRQYYTSRGTCEEISSLVVAATTERPGPLPNPHGTLFGPNGLDVQDVVLLAGTTPTGDNFTQLGIVLPHYILSKTESNSYRIVVIGLHGPINSYIETIHVDGPRYFRYTQGKLTLEETYTTVRTQPQEVSDVTTAFIAQRLPGLGAYFEYLAKKRELAAN